MKKLTLLIIISLSIGQLKSQINFGDDARRVEVVLKYGNKYPQTRYANGKIEYIVMCENDRYALDFKKHISYCDYYYMNNNERYIRHVRQFKNISIEELKSIYNELYPDNKIDNYYFDDTDDTYFKLYLSDNRYATVMNEKISTSNLSPTTRRKIENKKNEIKRKEVIKEKVKGDSIKSIVYDLETYSPRIYQGIFLSLGGDVEDDLFVDMIPSFSAISKLKDKKIRFHSIYNLHYGYSKNKNSNKFEPFRNITLISGNDDIINALETFSSPFITIENYTVHTEAKYENVKIEFVRGITKIEVKNGKVTFKEDYPDIDIQPIISAKLKDYENGQFILKYDVTDVFGQKKSNLETE